MDFGTYLWHLLQFAFWNPNNPVWSLIAWVAFVWGLFIWVVPHTNKLRPLQSLLQKINRWRFLILVALILSSVIVAAYSMQSNYVRLQLQNRPILIFNQITIAGNHTIATVVFPIENIGVNPAYRIHSRVCWAPESKLQLQNLSSRNVTSVNPLYPHNQIILPIEFVRNDSDRWYIYYLLEYSDAANKGTEYTEEYWFVFDFNTDYLSELTPTEKQDFQPCIDEFLAS